MRASAGVRYSVTVNERLPFAVDLLTDGEPGAEKHHVRIGLVLRRYLRSAATSAHEMAN